VAMANQAITPGEVLNIRWANDDPNPVAKRAIERANEDAVGASPARHWVAVSLFALPSFAPPAPFMVVTLPVCASRGVACLLWCCRVSCDAAGQGCVADPRGIHVPGRVPGSAASRGRRRLGSAIRWTRGGRWCR
jgi:hypothetical protein